MTSINEAEALRPSVAPRRAGAPPGAGPGASAPGSACSLSRETRRTYAGGMTDGGTWLLEEPHLVMGPLQLWVRGRQYPDEHGTSDGNWLDVQVTCESPFSRAEVSGPLLLGQDLERGLAELVRLDERVEGEAELVSLEPGLAIRIELGKLGSGTLRIELERVDTEHHVWEVPTDQSYLKGWIQQLRTILDAFPVRRES